MSQFEKKVLEFGEKHNIKGLQTSVSNVDTNELIETVLKRLRSPAFPTLWSYILKSFTDTQESHKKRLKVVFAILEEVEKSHLTATQTSSILDRLCGDFVNFKSSQLISLVNFCVELIQKGEVTEMCWKDLLPDILKVLSECECVHYNEIDMTGFEYKNQLIDSLCMMQWSPDIVIALTTMFIEIPLTKEVHLKVVNKLGLYMEKLTCQEIPSFVYQLLKLCRKQNSQLVFLRLQYYFGTRIYNKMNPQDSESTDIIGDDSDEKTIEVESTVLLHIYQNALNNDIIKDYLSSLKVLQKSPEFILHPFQLTVLLTLSGVPQYQENATVILKSCIARAANEENKMCESYWFREMIPATAKIEDVFKQIIDYSIPTRDLVITGLVQLSYSLLSYSPLLNKDAIKQWNLGKLILLKIMKKKTDITPCIINSLGNFVVTSQNPHQFIDCIYVACHKMPYLIFENQTCIMNVMNYLEVLPGPHAKLLFDAVLPLTKLSPMVRDHLILLLKKALYSRVVDNRQMAATGFMKLIRNLKINNMAALSQTDSPSSFASGYSFFTQVSVTCTGRATNSPFSNEALCFEVLDILKRCFMEQAEVRGEFYDGLNDAVCMNPELSKPVLDIIWNHFSKFYINEEDELPPLCFSKIYTTQDLTVTLQEPLGKLIFTIGLLIAKIDTNYCEAATIDRFKDALESLCTRMINCELLNFELDDGTDLLDTLPESQQKMLVLKETLSVYEALIGYKISSWNLDSVNNAQKINSLFQTYNRFIDFSKNLSKPKKADGKKKGKNKTTQQSQNKTGQLTQNKTKCENTKAAKSFVMPDTVMDFQTVLKAIQLLHKTSVDWASVAQSNLIKTKCDFHQFIMQTAIKLLQNLKNRKTTEVQHSKTYYNYIAELGSIIYERCIIRLDSFIDFDKTTSYLAAECFYAILNVISLHFKSSIGTFLKLVVGKESDFIELLMDVFKAYENILQLSDDESGLESDLKKLPLVVVNTMNLLLQFIPTTNNVLSIHVLEWLKEYINNKAFATKPMATAFFTLAFNTKMKLKSVEKTFETFALRLSTVYGSHHKENANTDDPKIIDELTAPIVFPMLCNNIKLMLDDVDWLILRLKAEYAMITYPGEDNTERRREYLKGKEKCVCSRLCPIISIVIILTNTTVPPGNLSEVLLKIIAHLYNTLNSLTKYFMARSSKINLAFQGALFERVVKLCGKQLSNGVYDFIMYIEESNKSEDQPQAKKSKDTAVMKTKILKDTRTIPKVIYELEQFGKSVIQLSNKTKVNLSKFVGQGTTRDFRIKDLKNVLEKAEHANQSEDTSIEENGEENNESVANDEGPRRKKRRVN